MLTETGQIVAIETEGVWVETLRASACQACKLKAGCGQHAMSKLRSVDQQMQANRVFIATDRPLVLQQEVQVLLPEQAFLKAALALYLLPLMVMLALTALLALWLPEPALILVAALGLALGFLLARQLSKHLLRQPGCRPQLADGSPDL